MTAYLAGHARRPSIRQAAVLALLASLCACGRSAREAGAAARDSAGVRIVEFGDTAPDGAARWRVVETPELDLGAAEGAPAQEFGRVSAALRFPDGRVAVADAGRGEIRIFDRQGRRLATAGRKGRGPGEFETVSSLELLPGDSLLAYDRYAGRLTWFDGTGKYVRSFSVGVGMGGPTEYAGRFGEGAFLLARSAPFRGPPHGALVRDTVTLLRRPLSGQADSLARFPGEEQAVVVRDRTVNRISYPYMRRTVFAVAGDGFWAGTQDDYALERRGLDGALELIVRRRVPRTPVRGAYLDGLRAAQRRAYGPEAERAMDGVPDGGVLPAYQRLLGDSEGNLWVERFSWPGDEVSVWDGYDTEGGALGTLRLPERFRLTQVGRGYVVGVRPDASDVDHVHVLQLQRRSENGPDDPS